MKKIAPLTVAGLILSYFALVTVVHASALIVLMPLFVASLFVFIRFRPNFFPLFFFFLPFFGELQEVLGLKGVPVGAALLLGPALLVARKSFKVKEPMLGIYFVSLAISLFVGGVYSALDFQIHQSLGTLAHHLGWNILFLVIPVTGLCLYFLMQEENFSENDFEKIFGCFLIGMMVCALSATLQYLGFWHMESAHRTLPIIEGRFDGTFIDPNILGFVAGIATPLCFSFLLLKKHWWIYAVVPALLYLLYLAGSRSSLIILAGASLVYLLLLKSWKTKINFLIVILLLGSFFFVVTKYDAQKGRQMRIVLETKRMITNSVEPIGSNKASKIRVVDNKNVLVKLIDYIFQSRGMTWKLAQRVIVDHWFWGVGLGRYMVVTKTYTTDLFNDNACNMYLQVAAEQGIIGAVGFLGMLGWIVFRFFRDLAQQTLFQRAAFATYIGVLFSFVFGAHLVNSEANSMFWFLIAILGAKVEHHS